MGDRVVTAMKARELGRGGVVVGDRVRLAGDADQLVIVSALANPPPRPRLIDRFLVAAYDAGIEPLLCLTKSDLATPDDLVATYEPLGVRFVVTGRPFGASLDELLGLLAGRISVLVGHSGVGKSTLVNALVPEAERAVGSVSAVTGRGRHTSSSVVALPLPGGDDGIGSAGWIIDTPGLRSFGLAHVTPERVVLAFPEFAEALAECAPGCSHIDTDCALEEWAAGHGPAAAARLDSLRRLLRSREGLDPAESGAG
jgi:ribosome biogenesis GTPase